MKYVVYMILLLISVSCHKHTIGEKIFTSNLPVKIVNGETVSSLDFFSSQLVIISINTKNGSDKICTGVFIDFDKILTAAHCISEDPSEMSITLRTPDFDENLNVIDLPVKNSLQFFSTKHQGRQDLGLVTVSTPSQLRVSPVELMNFDNLSHIISGEQELNLTLVGFGATDAGGAIDAQLRKKSIQIPSFELKKFNFEVDQNKNQGGVCFGDSGGPAFYFDKTEKKYFLVGIASAIIANEKINGCLNKSIFMNVTLEKNEIEELL